MHRVCRVVRVNRVRMAQVFFYGCIDDWKGKMKRLRDLRRRWVLGRGFEEVREICVVNNV